MIVHQFNERIIGSTFGLNIKNRDKLQKKKNEIIFNLNIYVQVYQILKLDRILLFKKFDQI